MNSNDGEQKTSKTGAALSLTVGVCVFEIGKSLIAHRATDVFYFGANKGKSGGVLYL
jgi:hypothetical protein